MRPSTSFAGTSSLVVQGHPKGAEASAIVYNIIETARANNLNIYTYLDYSLLYMPDTNYRTCPEDMEDMMPWSDRVRKECGK